ncbi:MAG: sigma-70 family RNA polymerase sigma factor [Lachnospiraceae bacterium]|nr:sigma-70 family RNA polymerase sigma factor [Lachnospiraceae bacterium]
MQSMDEIYRQYAQMVYRYLYSFTRNAHLAEELTQETFFQAVRTIHRYDGKAKLSTWLCAIAKNVFRTWQRKNPPAEELRPEAHTVPSAETQALQSAGHLEMIARLHNMPEPYREVLYLRIYGALSFREIGTVFGKTENWARITFYRGKEKLRKDVGYDE